MALHTTDADCPVYYVQKTLLASVAPKLSEHCLAPHFYLDVGDGGFRIFLAWLLYDKDITRNTILTAVSLAQAWNFGAQYDMPMFQDAVMRQLESYLKENYVKPENVLEAYKTTGRNTLLQRAIVSQLAIDLRRSPWTRDAFMSHGLEEVEGFCLDLIQAMCDETISEELNWAGFLLEDTEE